MTTTITIIKQAGNVQIFVNNTLIGTVKDGNTILRAIDSTLKANGCIRATGYSPVNGNLVAQGVAA
jgi:TfoX/Sxy family transcriptional regulator of competence genes